MQLLDVLCPATYHLIYQVAPTLGSAALRVTWQDLSGSQGPAGFNVEACPLPRWLPRLEVQAPGFLVPHSGQVCPS